MGLLFHQHDAGQRCFTLTPRETRRRPPRELWPRPLRGAQIHHHDLRLPRGAQIHRHDLWLPYGDSLKNNGKAQLEEVGVNKGRTS